MEYFSKIMPIFVTLVYKDRRHRGELLNFDSEKPAMNIKSIWMRKKDELLGMRKLLTILLLMLAMGMQAQQRQISYIKSDGAWCHVYDENGKKVTTLSRSTVGDVVGWGSDFFVTEDGGWVKIYDINGKKICTLSKSSVGKVIGVSGNTFTCRDGGWIIIYDKHGKRISTHSCF